MLAAWYRLADGYLSIQSEQHDFGRHFSDVFGACLETPADDTRLPCVECLVHAPSDTDDAVIDFTDPEPLDSLTFAEQIFSNWSCRRIACDGFPGGALAIKGDDDEVLLGRSGSSLIVRRSQCWEWVVGNLAVHRLLRLQRNVAVLHAASIDLGGRGTLLIGPKASGKTTLALALAARGHALLGDEMAPVRLDTFELLPLPRATSIRSGPRSPRVDGALTTAALRTTPAPGTARIRARLDILFPRNAARAVTLSTIVFLRSIGAPARLEPFAPGREHLRLLTPLGSTLWGVPPAGRAIRLLSILPRTRCFWLDVGDTEETADLVERTVHDPWD